MMNIRKTYPLLICVALLSMAIQGCKSKKIAVQPSAVIETKEEPVEEKQPEKPPVVEKKEPEPVVEKPNYNFKNILFEFDSGVLKTESYPVLDQIVREMKKDGSARFVINGHASLEGSPEHNMALSVDRANSVKLYLVNAGISSEKLDTKGYGATKPSASNDSETGRELNRRVEIKVIK